MVEKRAFFISIGVSALAMYLVYQYISGEDERLNDMYGTKNEVTIVRAKRDILQFATIRPTDVELLTVPKALIPPGWIKDKEDVFDAVAAIPIGKDEFILDNKLISKSIYTGLDSQISREKRAISVPVNMKSAVGYLLRPGNRVDLAAHFEYKASSGNASEVKVFIQDLLVLASGRTIQADPPKAVDSGMVRSLLNIKDEALANQKPEEIREALNYAKSDNNYQTVTLEATPQQAQTIVYVLTVYGDSLTLLLRHSDDRQLERTATTNLADVMGPDSYLVKGNKLPPQRAAPKIKFFDYQGDQQVPVYSGGP